MHIFLNIQSYSSVKFWYKKIHRKKYILYYSEVQPIFLGFFGSKFKLSNSQEKHISKNQPEEIVLSYCLQSSPA